MTRWPTVGVLAGLILAAGTAPTRGSEPAGAERFQEYARPGELAPLPEGMASLYRVPWRSNVRTVSAFEALEGIGVYYKHIPPEWGQEDTIHVMKQMAAAGVRRLRLAPHMAIYITKDWKAPKDEESATLRGELRGCKAADLRPCIVFVHVPPVGKPGTRELQEWWRQGELMPAGEVGSAEFNAYLDKTYEALRFILREAKDAGFTRRDSYDLEMGQGLWWGAPAVPRPMPSTDLRALRPGGRIYEFDRALIMRLRKDGFKQPTVWWGQTYHHFENCADEEVPLEAPRRVVSIYSGWSGKTDEGWLTGHLFSKTRSPGDVWPLRPALKFQEGEPPAMVLAKPETYMADRSRRDNLISLVRRSRFPVAITSLGTVPGELLEMAESRLDGWQIKQRALTRSLAFWLNQGASFVLLHSAYEPGSSKRGELTHSLIPGPPMEPALFRWHQAPPLVTLRSFCDGLDGAKPLDKPADLKFRYALDPDPVLIPATGQAGPLKASDAIALLTFQVDKHRFAVAAYVVSPNVAQPTEPMKVTLVVDRMLTDAGALTLRPYLGTTGKAKTVARSQGSTTLEFDLYDDVTWLRFEVQ